MSVWDDLVESCKDAIGRDVNDLNDVADVVDELNREVCRLKRERMYSEEDMRLAINKARDISDGKDCFDAEDISGCTEVCTYGWKFNMSEDLIIEQFKKK